MKRTPLRAAFGCALLAIAVLSVQPAIAAEDSLAAARDLYAAANYEDALAMLGRLSSTGLRTDEGRVADQYRALCLLALGKTAEASQAIEAVVSADPSYRPSESEVSPRVRSVFSEVRRRLLPALVERKYAEAKTAFDRKDYKAASAGFEALTALFADPDLAAAAGRPPLADLRLLVDGFHQLSVQALTPPPAPVPAPSPAAPQVAAAVPEPPRIYTSADARVVPPIVVRQELPRFNGVVTRPLTGAMEVVIDETGSVASATMRVPVLASYDRQATAAAQDWKYRPATLNGAPVRFRKLIQVSVQPQ